MPGGQARGGRLSPVALPSAPAACFLHRISWHGMFTGGGLMQAPFELPDRLSRREFLKASAAGLLALGVPVRWAGRRLTLDENQLGRGAEATADVSRSEETTSEHQSPL